MSLIKPNLSPGGLGFQVSRAAANLPQSTSEALYTISGGRVLVTLLLGEVTTQLEVLTNNTKIVLNRNIRGAIDLSASINVSSSGVGIQVTLDENTTDNLRLGPEFVMPVNWAKGGWILSPGTLDLDCDASSTGQIKWDLWYWPLDDGATVVAA